MATIINKLTIKKRAAFAHEISSGKIAAMPTDTIYGLIADAFNENTVKRIYTIKQRPQTETFIVLINKYKQLDLFLTQENIKRFMPVLSRVWPGPVTCILPADDKCPEYLKRNDTIAIRMPDKHWFIKFLAAVEKPVVAPSANIHGAPPCSTPQQNEYGLVHS